MQDDDVGNATPPDLLVEEPAWLQVSGQAQFVLAQLVTLHGLDGRKCWLNLLVLGWNGYIFGNVFFRNLMNLVAEHHRFARWLHYVLSYLEVVVLFRALLVQRQRTVRPRNRFNH